MITVDGFPIQNSINMLPSSVDRSINEWSYGKTISIEVDDSQVHLCPKEVQWQGKSFHVADYEFFIMLVKEWMQVYKWTKQEALTEMFGG